MRHTFGDAQLGTLLGKLANGDDAAAAEIIFGVAELVALLAAADKVCDEIREAGDLPLPIVEAYGHYQTLKGKADVR